MRSASSSSSARQRRRAKAASAAEAEERRELAIRQRLKDDYPHYARKCLRIRTKSKGVRPFELNEAQLYLHERLEEQRRAIGYVRAIILKGRQQGCSTYVQGRFFHRTTHARGIQAFIITHRDESTKSLFGMTKRFYEQCPDVVLPHVDTSNAKELVFDRLDSGYKVATAGSRAAGRGDTAHLFHGSEVAYWPNAEQHVEGALEAVPSGEDALGTEVILESTAAGPSGLFYRIWDEAERGVGEYIAIFIPWFWQREYRKKTPPGFKRTAEERAYSKMCGGLDDEQLAWRRAKIVALGGVHKFRREYPATPKEAFSAEVPGALWKREQLNKDRIAAAPEDLVRVAVAVDPSGSSKKTNSEVGITVGGKMLDGRACVMEDLSDHLEPAAWAARAVDAYVRHKADAIVAETNYGGNMVKHTIDTEAQRRGIVVNVKVITASRGKQVRAEPVAALYAQHRVVHVGHHPLLEDQMCTWVPGQKSPDRLDSAVWLLTDLMLDPQIPTAGANNEDNEQENPWQD